MAPSDGAGGKRGGRREANSAKKQAKPMVRFAEKRKRTVKGRQFTSAGGGVKKRSGGQAFRRRAKATS